MPLPAPLASKEPAQPDHRGPCCDPEAPSQDVNIAVSPAKHNRLNQPSAQRSSSGTNSLLCNAFRILAPVTSPLSASNWYGLCIARLAVLVVPAQVCQISEEWSSIAWFTKPRHPSRRRRGVLTLEWILLVTVIVIGIIGGLGVVRNATVGELRDLAEAITHLNVKTTAEITAEGGGS